MTEERTTPPLARVIPLGPHWTAIVYPDDTVVLRHESQVPILGTELVLNLRFDGMTPEDEARLEQQLQEIDPERLAVRTLVLRANGAIEGDQDAISSSGEPSEQTYQIFPPTVESAYRFFKRQTGRGNW